MKNTQQVRHNRGIKPASPQVKTNPHKNSNRPDDWPALVLFKDGMSVEQVLLTPAQFTQLKALIAANRRLNISLADMLEKALARMLIADDGFSELEMSKNQALTLMELLSQSILNETPGLKNGKFGGLLGAGLVDLVYATTLRLENAFNSAEAAARAKLEEVAS